MPTNGSIPLTHHLYTSVFLPKGWGALEWPMAGAFVLLVIINFFTATIRACVKGCCPSVIEEDIEIDEDIANYWASLDDNDRKWSLREEQNSRDACGMSILTDD